jgi:protein-tyrosine-phosphatase
MSVIDLQYLKIAVICRLNQARSPIIAEFIRQKFSPKSVISAGTNSVLGTNTPEIIIEIGKKWGLLFSATPCLQLEEIESDLRKCDLIIVVDQYTKDKIVQKYPDMKNLFMLTAGVGFSHLAPTDPVNMDVN